MTNAEIPTLSHQRQTSLSSLDEECSGQYVSGQLFWVVNVNINIFVCYHVDKSNTNIYLSCI